MAQNTTLDLVANKWTRITNATATNALWQNRGQGDIYVAATVGATPPTTTNSAVLFEPKNGNPKVAIANFGVGVTGANNLYAVSFGQNGKVFISHD